ncbi:Predicted lipid-binding transport protein, Tim44 family [Cohaesibacter sp. ES.047]|uniref:Tim44/TimA family putative adaptor protein n=1 Tax=Cohaesibacter sp. ES.047 TaxID=1798205 RepID=UPI000BB94008|nr:Tim44/TimA family putative adaptor protein [Cohaesibacter sp. ES.047]SNY90511.1 Predicted lipid-binding transport protein, Tim44 family [Cohaesibacter sp. ES.047]
MFESFDFITIIFLVIAVVLFMRLRDVLGTRTGNEREPYDPYADPDKTEGNKAPTADDVGDNVISLPDRPVQQESEDEKAKRLEKIAPSGSSLNAALSQLMALDKNFDPEGFISGSRVAYEMIVTAFAQGDRKTLKKLLAADVFAGFSQALDEREAQNLRVEFTFIGINKSSIVEAEVEGKEAQITVRFVSAITSCTKDDVGHVIEGDPNAIDDVTDIWTFSRDMSSRNPNWKLVGTESAQ